MSTARALAASLLFASALLAGAPAARADDAAEAQAKQEAQALVARLESKELEVVQAALTEAQGQQHPLVTAALVKRLADERFTVREAAMAALAARDTPEGKKQAAQGLAARLPRLAGPDDRHELLQALQVLRTLAQVVSLKAIADPISVKTEQEELRARLMAIANVPDAKAIELLIDLRAKAGNRAANEENRGAWLVRQALKAAIGQDLGADTDAWRAWWKDHAATFDFAAAAERRTADDARKADREAKKEEREKGGKRKEKSP